MDSDILSGQKNKTKLNNNECNIRNIKSKYLLKFIFNTLHKRILFKIIQHNKYIQNRLDLDKKGFKICSETYTTIEIDIIPFEKKFGKFINILTTADENFYHIYFNDKKEEIKRTWIEENDTLTKIIIVIDYQIKSFHGLFKDCECIKSIKFTKFYRTNIENTSEMFYNCNFLKEINLSNFNTFSVSNMSYMFGKCFSLKELNLTNFNTNKVINMKGMFKECASLELLNIDNFNTINVTDMSEMFYKCLLL